LGDDAYEELQVAASGLVVVGHACRAERAVVDVARAS